jgi:hypothetical protein
MDNVQNCDSYIKLSMCLIKHDDMKLYGEGGGGRLAAHVPIYGSRWRWVFYFTSWSSLSNDMQTKRPLERKLLDIIVCIASREKRNIPRPYRTPIPRSSSHCLVPGLTGVSLFSSSTEEYSEIALLETVGGTVKFENKLKIWIEELDLL